METKRKQKIQIPKLYCITCGSSTNTFYRSRNPKYDFWKKIPICQNCIISKYDELFKKCENSREALVNICQYLDIPYSEFWYQSSLKTNQGKGTELFQVYIKNINTLGSREKTDVGVCFDDSVFPPELIEENEDDKEFEDYYLRWGKGFKREEYDFLEEEYSQWCKTHKNDTRSEVNLLKEICITALQLRKTREMGGDTDKLLKQYQELMKTAAVSPNLATVAQGGKSMDAYGVWLKDIETLKPADWYSDKEKYKDMDGFGEYLKKYIFRPVKNFVLGTRDFNVDKEMTADFGEDDELDG